MEAVLPRGRTVARDERDFRDKRDRDERDFRDNRERGNAAWLG